MEKPRKTAPGIVHDMACRPRGPGLSEALLFSLGAWCQPTQAGRSHQPPLLSEPQAMPLTATAAANKYRAEDSPSLAPTPANTASRSGTPLDEGGIPHVAI